MILPVSCGGLEVRLATDLALPAFLSSVSGSTDLILELLPPRLQNHSGLHDELYIAACVEWHTRSNSSVPELIGVQKA